MDAAVFLLRPCKYAMGCLAERKDHAVLCRVAFCGKWPELLGSTRRRERDRSALRRLWIHRTRRQVGRRGDQTVHMHAVR